MSVQFGQYVTSATSCSSSGGCADAAYGDLGVLLEMHSGACFSRPFVVSDKLAIIRGFNLTSTSSAILEMIGGCGAGEFYAPVINQCGKVEMLTPGRTTLIVGIPGRYRLAWVDCLASDGHVELLYAPAVPGYPLRECCCDEGNNE